MKISKLQIENFQRNGVSGNGFYTATFVQDGKRFLATFETANDNEKKINRYTCRVVCLDDLYSDWNGGVLADEMNRQLWKKLGDERDIYDLQRNPEKQKFLKKAA